MLSLIQFQRFQDGTLPEDVALHGEQHPAHLCLLLRGGRSGVHFTVYSDCSKKLGRLLINRVLS